MGEFLEWWTTDRTQVLLTVLTLATALGLGARADIRRWLRRPKLKFVLGEEEPFVRLANSPDSKSATGNQIHVRVGVRNDGLDPARRAVAKLNRWFEHDGTKWFERDIDPVALHWVELPPADEGGEPPSAVDVYPGEVAYLDVLVRHIPSGRLTLQPHDARSRGFGLQAIHPRRYQVVEILVWTESAERPVRLEAEITFLEAYEPRVRPFPLPKDADRAGLLRKLNSRH